MSLVTSASPWICDDTITRKRQSTMRKPSKTPDTNENHYKMSSGGNSSSPPNFEDLETANAEQSKKVNELLDKITAVDSNEENNRMGSFNPIENPQLNVKKDIVDMVQPKDAYNLPSQSYLNASNNMKTGGLVYGVNDIRSAAYSNYAKSYEPAVIKPYYVAQNGNGMQTTVAMESTIGNGGQYNDNRLMEKINYMIHLLEQQQLDKTNNITEEFILYTFLGIFMIYICDSFARSGKYTR